MRGGGDAEMQEVQMSSPLKQSYLQANGTMEESKSPLRRGRSSLSRGRSASPTKSHNPNWRVDLKHQIVDRNRAMAGLSGLRSLSRAQSPAAMLTRKQKKKQNQTSEFNIS